MGAHKPVLSRWSACSTSCLLLQIPSPLPRRLAQGGAWAYIGSHFGRGWPDKLQAEKVRRGLGVWMGRGSWGGLRLKEDQHWALTSDCPASATLSSSVKWATTGVEGSWAHSVPPWAQEKARSSPWQPGCGVEAVVQLGPPSPPGLFLASFLLMCPRQDYGFCSSRGREGVSDCGGTAGRGQHHYSGETSPVLGAEWAGGEKGAVLILGWAPRAQHSPQARPMLQALKSEQAGFESQVCLSPAM